MTKKCFRCGKCCDNYLGIVPKYNTSNLSPKFLNKMSFEEAQIYLKNHSELMGHPCKWLQKTKSGLAKCLVYKNRSSNCRNYPDGVGDCRIGVFYTQPNKYKLMN